MKFQLPVSLALVASFVIIALIPSGDSAIAPDNVVSTLKIVKKTCYCPRVRSEEVAKKFMDCYDQAPGKEHFMKCQRETFNGVLFDTVANIRKNCAQPLKIPAYSQCLQREFEQAGEDMNDAVRKLNACQLPVVS